MLAWPKMRLDKVELLARSLGLKFDGDNESAEETPAARLGAAQRRTMQARGGSGAAARAPGSGRRPL
jgi:hypothetical protein